MTMNFFIVVLAGILAACSSANKMDAEALQDRQQQEYLRPIEEMVDNRQCDQVIKHVQAFRRAYPDTKYFQKSRILEGECLHELGQFKEAIKTFEEAEAATLDNNREMWADARYKSTFSYEALGDEETALSMLFGLEKSKAPLIEEIALAELPARIAALYFDQGHDKESREYLDKADRGLRLLMKEKGVENNRERFSQTLYHMGKVIAPQVTTQNFSRVMQAHQRSQNYLLRSMELNSPRWSQRAADDLIKSYRNYWNFIQTQWGTPEDTGKRIEALKSVHTMLSESMYRQPSEPENWTPSLKAYYSFANELEKEVSTRLYSSAAVSTLVEKTPSTQTPRTQKSPQPMPPKMKPQAPVASPDPNL